MSSIGKRCTYESFTEEQLLRAGRGEVHRVFGRAPAADPQVEERRLAAAMRFVEEVHACQHTSGWTRVQGAGDCAGCADRKSSRLHLQHRILITSHSQTCRLICLDADDARQEYVEDVP